MQKSRDAASELALAEQLDASGSHDDAINALARATKLGNLVAMTRLGKRLIVGDRAPLLPKEGVRFLIDSANLGEAEAAARLAALAAAGIYLDLNLDNSVQMLLSAAERGWRPAKSQLRALSTDRALAALSSEGRADYWHRLAETIDIAYWVSRPRTHDLHDSPRLTVYDSFIPDSVCDWLIDNSRDRLERAKVYDPVGGQEFADETRTNTAAQFNLMDTEVVHLFMQQRIAVATGISIFNMEATAILHYAVGEQITNHFDFVNPKIPNYAQEIAKNGQRIMTFLVYLNDDYAGGATAFPRLGIEHQGRRGQAFSFSNALENGEPDLRTVHAGRPTTSGEKWIVSQFLRNRRLLGIS